jgi:hypothetical protein
MKNLKLLLTVIFLISICASFQQVRAQEKTKEQQEADLKLQQKIDDQKKALVELKKAQEDAALSLDIKKSDLDSTMTEMRISLDNANLDREKIFRDLPRGNRFYFNDDAFDVPVSDGQTFSMHLMGGDSERTTWDFSKTVKDNTFSTDYSFDVEKTAKSVVMSVMGDCKSGEIRIKIVMPNGKSYSDILIDESGNLNWRKSFNISETENKDKTGDWKFQISSTKASGFFKISLQAF